MKDSQGHGSGARGGMTEKQKDQKVVDNIRGWLGIKPAAHQTGVEAARGAMPLPKGVTVMGLGDPRALHNTIARAVGEGRSQPPAKWSGKTARQRVGGTFGS